MVKKYIPKQGDVIFLNFNPTKDHEQAGFRPAVVISNNVFNQNTKIKEFFKKSIKLKINSKD